MKTKKQFWSDLAEFYLEWEMFQQIVVAKITKHILCTEAPPPPRKSCRLWDNVERYSTDGEVVDVNMAHGAFMQGTSDYKHTLSEYILLFHYNKGCKNVSLW
jgi:hypothetical protein